jgi:clan AA aspartic protease (TIGR02281 family)
MPERPIMLRTLAGLGLGLVVVCAAVPGFAADPSAPETVLKEKGLKRSGNIYILPNEAEFQKKLNDARAIYRAISIAAMRKQQFEQSLAAGRADLDQMEQQRMFLNQQLTQDATVQEHNKIVGMINVLTGQMNAIRRQEASPDVQQVPGARLAIQRQEFIEAVIGLRRLADKASEAYDGLAKDDQVAAALAALNQKGKIKFTLGPTRGFEANLKLLEKVEASVLTEKVDLRKEGGVFMVDVTFNGKTTKPMVFDTGASSIVLPAELASEIGLKPGPTDETVKAHVADGSVVEAKRMVIGSVRVGKFTVKDVDCIVMPAEKKNVPPLLGQTFHRHFIYKFSPDAGELILSQVETPEAAAPAPASKTKSATRAGRAKR